MDGGIGLVLPGVVVGRGVDVQVVHEQRGHQHVGGAGLEYLDPNRWAPANAAANARFLTTDLVRVDGATWNETVRPSRRAAVARQRWIRLASA